MLWRTVAEFTVACPEDYYEKGQSNIFCGNLRPVQPLIPYDPLYIIQCSHQVLRYSIVYIDENCQAAVVFINLGIQAFVRT